MLILHSDLCLVLEVCRSRSANRWNSYVFVNVSTCVTEQHLKITIVAFSHLAKFAVPTISNNYGVHMFFESIPACHRQHLNIIKGLPLFSMSTSAWRSNISVLHRDFHCVNKSVLCRSAALSWCHEMYSYRSGFLFGWFTCFRNSRAEFLIPTLLNAPLRCTHHGEKSLITRRSCIGGVRTGQHPPRKLLIKKLRLWSCDFLILKLEIFENRSHFWWKWPNRSTREFLKRSPTCTHLGVRPWLLGGAMCRSMAISLP